MKKLAMFPLSLLLVFSLLGCGTKDDDKNTTNDNTVNDKNTTTDTTNNDNATDDNSENGTTDGNDGMTNSNVEVADDAAEKITAMDEVDSSNVLVTDNNAYVGVVLKEGTEETDELKQKISDEVRNVHSEFDNVFISFNPDVAQSLTDYGDQIRAGDPVEGFFEEVADSINRMFPEAK